MSQRSKVDFDGLMRHLTVVGFAGLTAWTIVSATGLALGVFRISPHATLRFLLAVLILVFARRTYWEVQEWRWRHPARRAVRVREPDPGASPRVRARRRTGGPPGSRGTPAVG
jgi:hypothetical protein